MGELKQAGVWFATVHSLSHFGRPPCQMDCVMVVESSEHELGFTCVEFDILLRQSTGDAK